jgi:heptaprenyl diphosphate synthase
VTGLVDEVGLAPLVRDVASVEERLQQAVRADDRFLGEVAGHLLNAGGKRLRPMLTLCAGYAARGGDTPATPELVTGATAVELVHVGSLYHDDVIDEAETRRGVPSVNARWSNIVAILAGDYLLAAASERAASLGADVAGLLAATIGDLCRGQVLELQHLFDVGRTQESYLSAIAGKTATLFATACRIGGMVAGVSTAALGAVTGFGHHLGMGFQIVDDVLDLTGTEASLGKPAGNDLLEGVYTLPVIYALSESTELQESIGRPIGADALDRIRALVTRDGATTAALDVARAEAKQADEALAAAGDELDITVCAALRSLVDGLVTRQA